MNSTDSATSTWCNMCGKGMQQATVQLLVCGLAVMSLGTAVTASCHTWMCSVRCAVQRLPSGLCASLLRWYLLNPLPCMLCALLHNCLELLCRP
jgi:hypothetical protein